MPERATIEIDRRLGPEEPSDETYARLQRYIADHADVGQCSIEHEPPFMASEGLSDKENSCLAKSMSKVAKEYREAVQLGGAPYGTDAAAIAHTGVPTVVFGPGSIEQAHTADEFIDVKELQLASEILYSIAISGLQKTPEI